MKSVLCCLLCVLLLLSPISAQAEEVLSREELTELETLLIESMNQNEPVDVSQFGLTRDELLEIYDRLLNTGHFPWDSESYFDYVSNTEQKVTLFRPKLLRYSRFDEEKYEQKMAELIAETCLDGMEPWQKVLSIHDYINTRCVYYYYNSNNGYAALVNGKTQCYGYSRLFLEVMERIGIPCKIVIAEDTGDGVGHAWNVVELEGEWYHLDLTWDDPTGGPRYGLSLHDHFLKSDSQFDTEVNGHNFPWEVDAVCDGGRFSVRPVWKGIDNPIVFPDPHTMLLRRDTQETIGIYAVNCTTMEETLLYEEEIPSVSLSSGQFLCRSYGLSLHDGRVYFTNSKEVISILPDGTDRQVAYSRDEADSRYIISSHIQDGTVYFDLAREDGTIQESQAPLSTSASHAHSYDSQTFPATCTEGGYTQWSCSCGIQFQTARSKPVAHTLTEELIQDGAMEYLRQSCQNCSYTLDGEPSPIPTESSSPTATDSLTDPPEHSKPADVSQEATGKLLTPFLIAGCMIAITLLVILIARIKRKKRTH